jgi:GNAT superfamily N-acetyltransferase
LDVADLPACLALALDRDWGAEEHKWRLLFDVGEAFGMEDDAGELVAAAVLTRYPPGTAVISMVLVASRVERRGLGTRLMTHLVDHAGPGPVYLYATENGRPLYEKVGFATIDAMTTYVGCFDPSDGATRAPVSRAARDEDLPAILALDAEAFGADRSDLVARLPAFCEQLRVLERDGSVTGYGGAWRNIESVVIGPVIAADAAGATTLIAELAAGANGARIRLDVDHRNPELRTWATANGISPAFDTSLMVHGGHELPGERRRQFLPVMQALG